IIKGVVDLRTVQGNPGNGLVDAELDAVAHAVSLAVIRQQGAADPLRGAWPDRHDNKPVDPLVWQPRHGNYLMAIGKNPYNWRQPAFCRLLWRLSARSTGTPRDGQRLAPLPSSGTNHGHNQPVQKVA